MFYELIKIRGLLLPARGSGYRVPSSIIYLSYRFLKYNGKIIEKNTLYFFLKICFIYFKIFFSSFLKFIYRILSLGF